MKSVEAETSVAVEFLSSRVAEEARKDSIPLTDIELKQLSFTEETATAEQIAGARTFDEANDTDEFEARITRLLHSAFSHDVQLGMRATWEKHLAALRNHDVYVLVMVDQAGIRRPKPTVRVTPARAISPMALVRRLPDISAGLITVCGVVYFFILRIGWSRRGLPILGNLTDRLIPNEKFRGIFLFAPRERRFRGRVWRAAMRDQTFSFQYPLNGARWTFSSLNSSFSAVATASGRFRSCPAKSRSQTITSPVGYRW